MSEQEGIENSAYFRALKEQSLISELENLLALPDVRPFPMDHLPEGSA